VGDALESPPVARSIWAAVGLLKKWGLRVADVRFFLLHKTENAEELRKRGIPDFAIAKVLDGIRRTFAAIGTARSRQEIADSDDQGICLEKLDSALGRCVGPGESDLKAEDVVAIKNRVLMRSSVEHVAELKHLLSKGSLKAVAKFADMPPVNGVGGWDQTPDAH